MKYQNPIIKGFHPDPSICRVEEDYYLVTSSFEYVPGIPIYHSRDLVNWKLIGNCFSPTAQFPMECAKDSGGIWAPTIRYWKGKFYVTATLDQYGNFVISTEDIAAGWSEPVKVDMGGIDPSLYFEEDKVFYCTNQTTQPGREEISLAEIDIRTGALRSECKAIWSGMGGGFLEAPHIYHIGQWYYLMAAEGGTNFNHMITVARSRHIWGSPHLCLEEYESPPNLGSEEYESCPYNPILTNLHDTARQVQCAGHGDLFQDHLGNWWMVHLAIRTSRRTMSHLGRETFLTPVFWKEGWPVVDEDKKAKLEADGPLWKEQQPIEEWKADFGREEWEPEWIFLRKFHDSIYERTGKGLRLHPITACFADKMASAFAAVRPLDFCCNVETVLEFSPESSWEEAGLAVYLSSDFNYRIGKLSAEHGSYIVVEKRAEDFGQIAFLYEIESEEMGQEVRLKVGADKEIYYFWYAFGKQPYRFAARASTRFLSTEMAGKCFTGTVIGIYAFAENCTGTAAEFKQFVMKLNKSEFNGTD